MNRWTTMTLQVVVALCILGALVVQGVLLPIVWFDGDPVLRAPGRITVVLVGLWVLTLQVVGVCIIRLLTLVRHETVFSRDAFRWVDAMIGAFATGSVLMLAVAFVLAPGEEVPPGIVGLICGLSLVIAGVALLVVVMRALLAQAVTLRSELDGVI